MEQGCARWVRSQGSASLSRPDLLRRDPGSTSITECCNHLCSKENSNTMYHLKREWIFLRSSLNYFSITRVENSNNRVHRSRGKSRQSHGLSGLAWSHWAPVWIWCCQGDPSNILEILSLSLCQEPGPAQQHRHSTRTLLTLSGFGAESLIISPWEGVEETSQEFQVRFKLQSFSYF